MTTVFPSIFTMRRCCHLHVPDITHHGTLAILRYLLLGKPPSSPSRSLERDREHPTALEQENLCIDVMRDIKVPAESSVARLCTVASSRMDKVTVMEENWWFRACV